MQVVALRTDLRYSMSSLVKKSERGNSVRSFFDYSTNEPQFPYFSSSSNPFHHSFGRNCAMDGVWQHPFLLLSDKSPIQLEIGIALLQCGSTTLKRGIAVVQWNFADLAKPEPSLFDQGACKMKKKTRTLIIKRSSHTLLLYWTFIGQQ